MRVQVFAAKGSPVIEAVRSGNIGMFDFVYDSNLSKGTANWVDDVVSGGVVSSWFRHENSYMLIICCPFFPSFLSFPLLPPTIRAATPP